MTVRRLPERGDAFSDARGQARAMRVTQHRDDGVMVFSLWRDDRCTATFRLSVEDTGRLIALLAAALVEQLGHEPERPAGEAADADCG